MSDGSQQAEWLAKLCNNTTASPIHNNEDLLAAGVLLPPYATHDAFVNNIAIVAATLYCWEYIMTVPSELQIYFTIPWTAPHLLLFVLMRYSTLIAITLGLYATWHRQHGHCVAYSEVATLLVQLSVSAVLGWRTIAIWQKDARIIVIIALLLTTLMVFSSLLVLSMKPNQLQNGACVLVENGNYDFFPLYWFYAGTVLYDTLVIVLSIYRLWQHHNDVGVFPGANIDDTSKGGIGWARWIHSQWNSITPLLFRLTSNGVLYLAFSTGFNVVCFLIGHWNEDRAQDMMLLWSSVMWVVCQHLVLLEIRATWGDRSAIGLGCKPGASETDRLIAQILNTSWPIKSPPNTNTGKDVNPKAAQEEDPEILLSLSMDSCLKATPKHCCGGLPNELQHRSSKTLRRYNTTGQQIDDLELCRVSTVQQLHDFRPSMPGESFDGFASRTVINSDRIDTMDGNTSANPLITHTNDSNLEDKRNSGIRHRIGGAIRNSTSSNRFLATLTKSPRSDTPNTLEATLPHSTTTIEHPLMDNPQQQRHSTSSRLLRISPVPSHSPSPSNPTPCKCGCPRRASTSNLHPSLSLHLPDTQKLSKSSSTGEMVSSLEIADMLANMSDDAKSTALALAGMEGALTLPTGLPFTTAASRAEAEAERPSWIIHPPLM